MGKDKDEEFMAEREEIANKTYEEAFDELESIVNILEGNQRPLEEAMDLFERGQALAQYCAGLLDKAELRVRQLGVDGSAGGEGLDE